MPQPRTVETERLILRQFEERDADDIAFYADPVVMRFLPRGPEDPSKVKEFFTKVLARSRDAWSRHGFGMWAVELKQSGHVIGHCGLQHLDGGEEVEVFYLLDKPHWNQGMATEATKAALRFGFDVARLPRIVAIAMPENVGSLRVMEKAGLRYEGPAVHYKINCVKYGLSREQHRRGA